MPLDVLWSDGLLKAGLAFLLALPLGWEREKRARAAGLRTYPLLAVAAFAFLSIARRGLAQDVQAQANVFFGLLAGIGFFGSGAIVNDRDRPRGMATAVSLWLTGAIGASVAYGIPQVGAAVSLLCLATMTGSSLANNKGEPS